jgi:hypothetical protein
MIEHPQLVHIGQVAVFYFPAKKLYENIGGKPTHEFIHEFLIQNYDAYTLERGQSNEGFWRRSKDGVLCHDTNVRYEVSFAGKEKIPAFIDFLSKVCTEANEEAIYLTMGRHSYFVTPKGNHEI